MRAQQAHLIVLGNEKGGSGKSTTAVHIAVALAHTGAAVGIVDLDGDGDVGALTAQRDAWAAKDYIVIDTPGRDSPLARAALSAADTLVTPMNDSFVDFDLIGQVDPETYKVSRPSFYAELVWQSRQKRARADGGTVDWVVLRNRLSTLEARNMKRVAGALEELAKRVGFRVVPGLSERVIFRELFPRGLTLLDIAALEDFSVSHIAARLELQALVGGLRLPARGTPGVVAAVA